MTKDNRLIIEIIKYVRDAATLNLIHLQSCRRSSGWVMSVSALTKTYVLIFFSWETKTRRLNIVSEMRETQRHHYRLFLTRKNILFTSLVVESKVHLFTQNIFYLLLLVVVFFFFLLNIIHIFPTGFCLTGELHVEVLAHKVIGTAAGHKDEPVSPTSDFTSRSFWFQ